MPSPPSSSNATAGSSPRHGPACTPPVPPTPATPSLGLCRSIGARTGAGHAALAALCDAYEARGFWKFTSRIFPENTAGLALHERAGFRVVGVYHRHGMLDGEWRDCVIVEKLLGDAAK